MYYNRTCVGLAGTADNQGISYPGRFMEHDHQPIDPPNNGTPIGYCPHCNYQLLAPGICHECGNQIGLDQIRKAPRWLQLRRWARRECELPCAQPPDRIIRLNNVERAGS